LGPGLRRRLSYTLAIYLSLLFLVSGYSDNGRSARAVECGRQPLAGECFQLAVTRPHHQPNSGDPLGHITLSALFFFFFVFFFRRDYLYQFIPPRRQSVFGRNGRPLPFNLMVTMAWLGGLLAHARAFKFSLNLSGVAFNVCILLRPSLGQAWREPAPQKVTGGSGGLRKVSQGNSQQYSQPDSLWAITFFFRLFRGPSKRLGCSFSSFRRRTADGAMAHCGGLFGLEAAVRPLWASHPSQSAADWTWFCRFLLVGEGGPACRSGGARWPLARGALALWPAPMFRKYFGLTYRRNIARRPERTKAWAANWRPNRGGWAR